MGAGSDRSSWTVGRVVLAYIADREADGIASTARQRDAWKAMKPFWERCRAPTDRPRDGAVLRQARGMAAATIRYELGCCRWR
jgi:hypothetical protein